MRASAPAVMLPLLPLLLAAVAAGDTVPEDVSCLSPLPEQCPLDCGAVQGAEQGEPGCRCADADAVLSSDYSACLVTAFAGHGAQCEDSAQCVRRMGPGAACLCPDPEDCELSCQCRAGFHYLRGRCWRTRGLGESCSSDEQCAASWERDALVCSSGVCDCAPGTTYRPQPAMCRRAAAECEPCEFDLDCDPDPERATGFRCEEKSFLCQNASSTCAEEPGASSVAPPPKAEAESEAEVQTPGNRTVCRPGYFRLGEGEEAACVRELGEPCASNADCPLEDGRCRPSAKGGDRRVCGCEGTFLPLAGNQECTKRRPLCNVCYTDEQCAYYGGVCVSRKCVCPPGQHFVQARGVCWPSSALGGQCSSDHDCYVPTDQGDNYACDVRTDGGGVNCTAQGVCECVAGYHPAAGGDCRPDANALGQPCVTVEDCVFAAGRTDVQCSSAGQCACAEGYFPSGSSTGCSVGVGGPCAADGDCAAVRNGSSCERGQCACRSGWVAAAGGDICLAEAREYGASCSDGLQCAALAAGVECAQPEGRCRCEGGLHWRGGSCWETRYLGDECERISECLPAFSECRKGLCACEYGRRALGKGRCAEAGASAVGGGRVLALALALAGSLLAGAGVRGP